MHAGNFVGNRQTQAVALPGSARHPVKPLQHPAALLQRNARSIVFNFKKNPGLRRVGSDFLPAAYGDVSAEWRVLDGVIHQVSQQLAQQPFVSGHLGKPDLQPQVNAFGRRGVEMHGEHRLAQVFQVHPLHRLAERSGRISPRQGQQLVGKLGRAPGGVAQARNFFCRKQYLPPGRRCPGCLRPCLDLGLQPRQRCAQLVRSVGDKTTLALGLVVDQPKKPVQ